MYNREEKKEGVKKKGGGRSEREGPCSGEPFTVTGPRRTALPKAAHELILPFEGGRKEGPQETEEANQKCLCKKMREPQLVTPQIPIKGTKRRKVPQPPMEQT